MTRYTHALTRARKAETLARLALEVARIKAGELPEEKPHEPDCCCIHCEHSCEWVYLSEVGHHFCIICSRAAPEGTEGELKRERMRTRLLDLR